MSLIQINPLTDSRWQSLVDSHPHASIFHTRAWLKSLQETYGFNVRAVACLSPTGQLSSAIPFCEVRSRLSGCRLVSLPFSDHCEPLCTEAAELSGMIRYLADRTTERPWKHLELRPITPFPESVATDLGRAVQLGYLLHRIDLRPTLKTIFETFHSSCVRGRIRKAEGEGLRYEVGSSERLLTEFYSLLLLTRRRHRLPPQPLKWFRSIVQNVGADAQIRLVSYRDQPVAAIFTLVHRDSVTYKYGVSNAEFNRLGGVPYLFWRAIREAKEEGCSSFDLGRTDLLNSGLITFKERLGAERRELTYVSCPTAKDSRITPFIGARLMKWVIPHLPQMVVTRLSRLYRHAG